MNVADSTSRLKWLAELVPLTSESNEVCDRLTGACLLAGGGKARILETMGCEKSLKKLCLAELLHPLYKSCDRTRPGMINPPNYRGDLFLKTVEVHIPDSKKYLSPYDR